MFWRIIVLVIDGLLGEELARRMVILEEVKTEVVKLFWVSLWMTKKMITFNNVRKKQICLRITPHRHFSGVPRKSKLINILWRVRRCGYSIVNKYLSYSNITLKSRREKYSIKYNKSSLSQWEHSLPLTDCPESKGIPKSAFTGRGEKNTM